MPHQEAPGAGELVGLPGQHPYRQFLMGEIGSGELEGFGRLDLVLVDLPEFLSLRRVFNSSMESSLISSSLLRGAS